MLLLLLESEEGVGLDGPEGLDDALVPWLQMEKIMAGFTKLLSPCSLPELHFSKPGICVSTLSDVSLHVCIMHFW